MHSSIIHKLGNLSAKLIRILPPETAHNFAISLLKSPLMEYFPVPPEKISEEPLANMKISIPEIGTFSHPLGLGAGFDKNAHCLGAFSKLNFSFVETGTITPRPQKGNPKPRLFRFPEDRSLINRMGFNSDGMEKVFSRVNNEDYKFGKIPIGINVGKNKTTPNSDALSDYLNCLTTFEKLGDYFVVNISSPNTKGLRELASSEFLERLSIQASHLKNKMFIKLDPDMDKKSFVLLIEAIAKFGFKGVILSNTHRVDYPTTGGLSGHPLSSLSQKFLELAYEVHKGSLVMIASGGILSGLDVYQRMIRGASLCQIYSAFIYRGPFCIWKILEEFNEELKLRGIKDVNSLIGSYYSDQ